MNRIDYSVFDGQTSSSEDLYLLGDYIGAPKTSKAALKGLLKHYDKDVVREAKKLAKGGWKKAAQKSRAWHQRNGWNYCER